MVAFNLPLERWKVLRGIYSPRVLFNSLRCLPLFCWLGAGKVCVQRALFHKGMRSLTSGDVCSLLLFASWKVKYSALHMHSCSSQSKHQESVSISEVYNLAAHYIPRALFEELLPLVTECTRSQTLWLREFKVGCKYLA